jgi:hypothetical protein
MRDNISIYVSREDLNVLINGLGLALYTKGLSKEAEEYYRRMRDRLEHIHEANFS